VLGPLSVALLEEEEEVEEVEVVDIGVSEVVWVGSVGVAVSVFNVGERSRGE